MRSEQRWGMRGAPGVFLGGQVGVLGAYCRSSTRGTALPQIPNFQKASDPARPINIDGRLRSRLRLVKAATRRYRGCTNGRSTTFVHRACGAHTVSAQWPLTAPRGPIPSFAQKVSSYLLPPGLPNSTGGALPAALPHSPALSPPTQTTLICAFISPFRRRLGPPLDLNSARPPRAMHQPAQLHSTRLRLFMPTGALNVEVSDWH